MNQWLAENALTIITMVAAGASLFATVYKKDNLKEFALQLLRTEVEKIKLEIESLIRGNSENARKIIILEANFPHIETEFKHIQKEMLEIKDILRDFQKEVRGMMAENES